MDKSVITSLPKTDDKQVMYPGMTVYYVNTSVRHKPITGIRITAVSADSFSTFGGGLPYIIKEKEVGVYADKANAYREKICSAAKALKSAERELELYEANKAQMGGGG